MPCGPGHGHVLGDAVDGALVKVGQHGGEIFAGFSTYEVKSVEFYHLGQGGVIGRYPVHFHMDRKVPQPVQAMNFQGAFIADSSIMIWHFGFNLRVSRRVFSLWAWLWVYLC